MCPARAHLPLYTRVHADLLEGKAQLAGTETRLVCLEASHFLFMFTMRTKTQTNGT